MNRSTPSPAVIGQADASDALAGNVDAWRGTGSGLSDPKQKKLPCQLFDPLEVPLRRLHLGAALIAFPEYASATVSLT